MVTSPRTEETAREVSIGRSILQSVCRVGRHKGRLLRLGPVVG